MAFGPHLRLNDTFVVEPFKGKNGEECNSFIRAIRAAAWKQGKLRDAAWMADFASLQFSHQALSWHSRLTEDVRQDWTKLEVAIYRSSSLTPDPFDFRQLVCRLGSPPAERLEPCVALHPYLN